MKSYNTKLKQEKEKMKKKQVSDQIVFQEESLWNIEILYIPVPVQTVFLHKTVT